jgi:hypothetical protein
MILSALNAEERTLIWKKVSGSFMKRKQTYINVCIVGIFFLIPMNLVKEIPLQVALNAEAIQKCGIIHVPIVVQKWKVLVHVLFY